jgi:S-DNA-T family DNA segregation ATPase FtsK/SpoIIIE
LIGEREQDGELLYLNLFGENGGQPQHGPHTLIAGETGGGKGVLTRNIVLDILATNSPQNARIRFVDPKYGADYPWLEGMPHLDGGIVDAQEQAIETLRELVEMMEDRYALITKQGRSPNIDHYNAKVEPEKRLPRIYLFHDEIGDWMADKNSEYPDAVSNYVVRLASKARAAGVHLFLITQRPDKDALPSQIKANMSNKICLRVSSGTNSRIVLDESGAETLLGQGHFAAKLANEPITSAGSIIFGQAPVLPDEKAWELAEAIRTHWGRSSV